MDPISFVAAFSLGNEPKPELPPPPKAVTLIQQKILEGIQFKPSAPPKEEKPIHSENDAHQELKPTHATPSQPSDKTKEKPGEPSRVLVKPHSIAPAPILWKLADRHGTTWFHTNKNYLEWWVAQRSVPPPIQSNVQSYYPTLSYSSCAGGSCHR